MIPPKIIDLLIGSFLASIGGIVHYIYNMSKNEHLRFSWKYLVIHAILAAFVGFVFWDLAPSSMTGRLGLAAISGFLALPILVILETQGPKLFKKLLQNFSSKNGE